MYDKVLVRGEAVIAASSFYWMDRDILRIEVHTDNLADPLQIIEVDAHDDGYNGVTAYSIDNGYVKDYLHLSSSSDNLDDPLGTNIPVTALIQGF